MAVQNRNTADADSQKKSGDPLQSCRNASSVRIAASYESLTGLSTGGFL